MMLVAKTLISLVLFSQLFACSKKEPIYTKEEMLAMTPMEGPDKVEIVLARDINDAVPCADYGDGCLSAHRLRTRGLGFIAVEFETPAQAESSAKKIYGYTARNWLLDDVDGEPTLERWAEQYLKAKPFNPQKAKEQATSAAPTTN